MGTGEAPSTTDAGRYAEVDHLKAVGILAVILIHSIREPWDPRLSDFEIWLGNVTRFAVPAFLLCSGFLYATREAIPPALLLRRLRRVLVPYLIASAGAQLWLLGHGEGRALPDLARELVFASSFGPYYYVFVHFWLVLCAPVFARLPTPALWALTLLLLLAQALLETQSVRMLSFYWHLRNPLLWWGYFLVGWLLRLHYAAVRAFVVRHRVPLVAAAAALAVAAAAGLARAPAQPLSGGLLWLGVYAIIGAIFAASCGGRSARPALRTLADATFAIYLFHLFFVYAAEDVLGPATGRLGLVSMAANWCAGLLGSLILIALFRRVLGARSRDVIGA